MSAAVIALPTAAPKKVRQCRSRTKASDRDALLCFPDRYKPQWQRKQEERIALAMEADLPSLALMVFAIGRVLGKREQRNVAMYLAIHAKAVGGPEACVAWETFVTDPARTFEGGE